MSNKIQFVLIIILIPIGGLFLYLHNQHITVQEFFFPSSPIVHFGDIPVRVEVADTESKRIQGLSGRDEIGNHNAGMFFIFPKADYLGIWMKDMKFPIDIIWIDENLTVIGIEQDVSPNTYPRVFRPQNPAKYVLETEVHYADLVGIRVGQKVRIPLEK